MDDYLESKVGQIQENWSDVTNWLKDGDFTEEQREEIAVLVGNIETDFHAFHDGVEDYLQEEHDRGYEDCFEGEHASLKMVKDAAEDICPECPLDALRSCSWESHFVTCCASDYKGNCGLAAMRLKVEE